MVFKSIQLVPGLVSLLVRNMDEVSNCHLGEILLFFTKKKRKRKSFTKKEKRNSYVFDMYIQGIQTEVSWAQSSSGMGISVSNDQARQMVSEHPARNFPSTDENRSDYIL